MELDFFKKTRILDGGMGQELLARGMKPNRTLWSANAVLKEEYHQLVLDTHSDFIKAGAEVIVTATFTMRRKRLRDNSVEDQFEYLNKKAGEIAQKTRINFPNIKIAGGLPPQNLTYEADERDEVEIEDNLNEQAQLLDPFVDFYYFDVLSSIKEFRSGIKAIKEFKKPYLIGMHISEGTRLPSGEKISEIKHILDQNAIGVILSCISPEIYEQNFDEIKSLGVPFGFKLNAFKTTKPRGGYTNNYVKSNGNPNEFLGQRKDLTPEIIANIAKRFRQNGATILGGCCETTPLHIKRISDIVKVDV